MEHDIDRFKKIVDNIFEGLESMSNKEGVKNLFESTVTEVPADKEAFAVQKALEEFEAMRQAFVKFQDEVSGLMIFNHMTSSFERFGDYASDLIAVIEDKFDEKKLDSDTLKRYKVLRKLRAQILANVYNRYKNKDK